jgi:hypothetical protein
VYKNLNDQVGKWRQVCKREPQGNGDEAEAQVQSALTGGARQGGMQGAMVLPVAVSLMVGAVLGAWADRTWQRKGRAQSSAESGKEMCTPFVPLADGSRPADLDDPGISLGLRGGAAATSLVDPFSSYGSC